MGEEISDKKFDQTAYAQFNSRVDAETSLLRDWILKDHLNDERPYAGFEQEAWLIDTNFNPAPLNEQFIKYAKSELVSAELAKFNIELNVNPLILNGDCLRRFHHELESVWKYGEQIAAKMDTKLIMIGILPTVKDSDLVLPNMSTLNRYKALNEQVMLARKGIPMHLDIIGHEHLQSVHYDVMLESAATSFQLHRQIPVHTAPRYINAAIILSAITVAAGANSPYLFGKQLWEETRIPLFEQSVEVGGLGDAVHGPIRRVTFGSGYLRHDIMEYFQENLEHYPVLLPVELESKKESLPHLRLHNGTIWRWNRPLVGFNDNGIPHVRIEHRVVAAGPTIIDEIANAAFFYGLQEWMAELSEPAENRIEHAIAKSNFYEAARLGINANIKWFDNKTIQIGKLIQDDLINKARIGLQQLEIDKNDIDDYLGIIEARVKTGQTGSCWQKTYILKNGSDMSDLLHAYYENQKTGQPVHNWPI